MTSPACPSVLSPIFIRQNTVDTPKLPVRSSYGSRPAMNTPPHRSRQRYLTIVELCDELGIGRSTFYEWRAKRRAPRCIKLPNGELRIRRTELETWLDAREEAA
jgi:excisionase family DNA binding protein